MHSLCNQIRSAISFTKNDLAISQSDIVMRVEPFVNMNKSHTHGNSKASKIFISHSRRKSPAGEHVLRIQHIFFKLRLDDKFTYKRESKEHRSCNRPF